MSYLAAVQVRTVADTPGLTTGSSSIRFVAPGSVTEGRYGLFEYRMAARAPGPGPHYHQTFAEAFFVLSGTLTIYGSDAWTPFGAGDYVHVHDRGVHGFRNDSDEETAFLIMFAPGIARERYFEELAEIYHSGRTPSAAEMADLYARHDQVNL